MVSLAVCSIVHLRVDDTFTGPVIGRPGAVGAAARQLFVSTAEICAFYLDSESRSIAFSQQLPTTGLARPAVGRLAHFCT